MRTIQPFTVEINVITSKGWMPAFAGMTPSEARDPGSAQCAIRDDRYAVT
jgi:hypothetical protein